MPLYEYQCENCEHRFEKIQKFSDPPPDACPKCGGPVRKLFSSPAIQFKGSGFYITDYAKKSAEGQSGSSEKQQDKQDKQEKKEKKDKTASGSDKSDSGSAKTDSGSGGKTDSGSSSSGDSTPASTTKAKE